jgi:S1-C subfamily serine protease
VHPIDAATETATDTATDTATERGLPARPPDPAPPTPPGVAARVGFGRWLLAALVGAVVGALVASGIFVAVDDPGSTTTVVRPARESTVSRPSRVIPAEADVAAIIAKVEPAVVAITTGSGAGSGDGGAGTGFVITGDGFVVTNHHVVDGASRITVAFTNGDEKPAELVGREVASDIAVLKVDGENLPTVELGESDDMQVGDEVVAIGNALALDGGLSVTRGIVSGLHRTVSTNTGSTLIGMLQTDAAINPGNSGGPLVDASGRVVAINTAIANPQAANNVGFAIPMANAKPIIDDLRLGRPAAFLGVSTLTVTPAMARQQNLGVTDGALVTRVTAGSAADQAGIAEGDVIVAIAGESVTEASDVQALVRAQRPGDVVDVVLDRGGEQRTVQATLTERPAA